MTEIVGHFVTCIVWGDAWHFGCEFCLVPFQFQLRSKVKMNVNIGYGRV